MHRNYYEPSPPQDEDTQSQERGREWVLTPPAEAFGEVPGELPSLSPATPHEAAKPPKRRGRRGSKAGRREKRADPNRRRRHRVFFLFLALLLILGGAALALRLNHRPADPTDPSQGQEEVDWTELLEDTSAARAPTGDGTTLTLTPLEGEALTPQEIYRQVNPSVVGVRAIQKAGVSLGTGVILSADGYIVTNAHVISGGQWLYVVLSNNATYDALLVGYDEDTDLAVLKIAAKDLPAACFGDSATLQVGDVAYAIGNPLGEELRGTMTDGIISAIDRDVDMDGTQMTLIQTTAALNPGNSGGALINDRGQVVGITNMKMMSSFNTIEGLGFAIPTTTAKTVVDQIIDQGFYDGPGMLGVTVQNRLDPDAGPLGAYVKEVIEGSDAYAQGIRVGDVITSAGGHLISTIDDLQSAKADLGPGDSIQLEIWRNGETFTVTVRLMGNRELNGDKD